METNPECACAARVIGEWERANLVVATGRFSIYLFIYFYPAMRMYDKHTVMFYVTLKNCWLALIKHYHVCSYKTACSYNCHGSFSA